MTPDVSVLVPAWDAAATLPACLASVLRQRDARWECIVVDDGSADGTRACAEAFAARDGRFRVVATPHRGLVHALNAGLEACRGAVVARMDADDVMHRDRLAAQLRALRAAPELDAVGCHVRLFPRAELRGGLRRYERWLNAVDSPRRVREEAFVECPVAHPTLALRMHVARTLGWRDVGWPEDYDLVLRLLARGGEVGVVPRRLVAWREHPARLSRTDARYRLERFTACKAAFLATGLLARTDTYVLWGHGPTARALKKALQTHGKHPSHVVEVHPRRLGTTIDGARVLSPRELKGTARAPLIAAVSGDRPRRLIREFLRGLHYEETRDFVCAA